MTLVGWCPGRRTVGDMLARYPETRAVRIFVGPQDPLPAWDGPILGPLSDQVVPHLSFKRWEPDLLKAWGWAKPPGRLLILTYGHEPEQGEAKGDPPLEVFRTRWAELVNLMADHPERHLILLVPTYTRYWWQENAGDLRWLVAYPGIDAIGWDIYNNGSTYRSADDLLTVPRDIATRTGLPYLIAELGAVRIASDRDGSGRQAWMRDMVAAAVADRAITCCWFHKDAWDLAAGAEPERQTWADITRQEVPVTSAPDNLLAARQLLLEYLNFDEDTVRADDLEPAEVGIVGDTNHWGGYHCGRDRTVRNDYSVVESTRDSSGLTEKASALDVGMFEHRAPDGKVHNLQTFSVWVVGQCQAGAADTRDIREVIYSPDGKTVKRWDRLGKRSGGDSSHVFHTHFSFFRDSTKAGRDQTPLFRRYLTTIGLLEDDDMPTADAIAAALLAADLNYPGSGSKNLPLRTLLRNLHQQQHGPSFADWQATKDTAAIKAQLAALATAAGKLPALIGTEGTSPDELAAALAALPTPVPVDVDQLAAAVAERVITALPDSDAGPISREDLEAALRSALGSLDGATPQS